MTFIEFSSSQSCHCYNSSTSIKSVHLPSFSCMIVLPISSARQLIMDFISFALPSYFFFRPQFHHLYIAFFRVDLPLRVPFASKSLYFHPFPFHCLDLPYFRFFVFPLTSSIFISISLPWFAYIWASPPSHYLHPSLLPFHCLDLPLFGRLLFPIAFIHLYFHFVALICLYLGLSSFIHLYFHFVALICLYFGLSAFLTLISGRRLPSAICTMRNQFDGGGGRLLS